MKNISLILMSLVPTLSFGWSEHGLLTKEALSVLPEATVLRVEYQPLETLVPKLGLRYHRTEHGPSVDPMESLPVKSTEDLNLYLRIKRESAHHHGFEYQPRLNEKPGMKLSAVDVLAHYADEPDGWTDTHKGDEPDTMLFDEDQYPQLWKKEYEMLGGKTGLASQAFRHMWWAPLSIWHPLATFKLPKIIKPMGEAPERLLIYLELSRASQRAGSRYWQLRFLANALHYLQDCTQPFHVTQTPSKKFLTMASRLGGWAGGNFKMGDITKRTTQLVAYYHWSYEDFIGRIFKNPSKFKKAHKEFSAALKKSPAKKIGAADEYLMDVAKTSVARAPVSARTAIQFFPQIPKSINLTTWDPSAFMDDAWWAEVEERAGEESKSQRKYFNSVRESFELFGESVRSLVKAELSR